MAQTVILLQYDMMDKNVMSVGELMSLTGLPQSDLKTALFHLCKPKVQLLDKQIKKPTFDNPDELIRLNKAFKSKTRRLVLAP